MAAITDAYSDAETYRGLFDKSSESDDAAILEDLTAVSRYLDRKLGRFFTKDASDATREFTREPYTNPRLLWTNDIVSVTSIKVDEDLDGSFDETALADSDYELRPKNAADGPEPRPYSQIWIPAWSTKSSWPDGRPVQVVGVFGWPSIPSAIARATLHLTGILRLESPRATRTVTEMDQVLETSRQAQDIVKELASVYQKVSF